MKKECKIILLPTKEESNIHLEDGGILMLYKEARIYSNTTPQHLYVISDDEIKEGDWISCPTGIIVFTKALKGENFKGWKKIIATTNPEFHKSYVSIDDVCRPDCILLPQISQSDIEYIISLYNEKRCKFDTDNDGNCQYHPQGCLKSKEINVYELANEHAFCFPGQQTKDEFDARANSFIVGYEKALQDNVDKKFTLEQVMSSIKNSYGLKYFSESKFIENLNSLTKGQPKSNTVMVEYETANDLSFKDSWCPSFNYEPKLKDGSIVIHQ